MSLSNSEYQYHNEDKECECVECLKYRIDCLHFELNVLNQVRLKDNQYLLDKIDFLVWVYDNYSFSNFSSNGNSKILRKTIRLLYKEDTGKEVPKDYL